MGGSAGPGGQLAWEVRAAQTLGTSGGCSLETDEEGSLGKDHGVGNDGKSKGYPPTQTRSLYGRT